MEDYLQTLTDNLGRIGKVTRITPEDSSGPTPSGTISIVENGTYDVAQYAEAEVNVAGGDPREDLLKLNNNSLESFSDETITFVRDYLFYGSSNLKSIVIPNVTSIGTSSFDKTGITGNVVIDKFAYVKPYAFKDNHFETITFRNGLYRVDISMLEGCSSLTTVDIGDPGSHAVMNIGGAGFYRTTSLSALIVRRTADVFPLGNAFPSTCKLAIDGMIYVPQSLLSTYKSATNWSQYADRIVSIEGSIYENAYADGTPIS